MLSSQQQEVILSQNQSPADFTLRLPEWLASRLTQLDGCYPDPESRMHLILALARENVEKETGGPFAAGVFIRSSGQLISLGVNRVMATNCSQAHAEVMALSLAQKRLTSYDLGAPGMSAHELVVNWRPCAMCYGALLWSGIRHLTIAGDGPELERETGFDEGPIIDNWQEELRRRTIGLTTDILRPQAVELFRWFGSSGATVYNARQGINDTE